MIETRLEPFRVARGRANDVYIRVFRERQKELIHRVSAVWLGRDRENRRNYGHFQSHRVIPGLAVDFVSTCGPLLRSNLQNRLGRALFAIGCNRSRYRRGPDFPEWPTREQELVEAHHYGSIQHTEGARRGGYPHQDRNATPGA
jgi:hypothetical protein